MIVVMTGVFMAGGMLNSVEALLVPRLQFVFGYGHAEALLVQLAYYSSYLVLALPAASLTARTGSIRATAIGLAIVAAGCFALVGAFASRSFAAMLAVLLTISAGVTVLQIACNGLMATAGDGDRATARFTMVQGFNSVGTAIGPLVAARLLLGERGAVAPAVPFLGFAMAFGALAFAAARLPGGSRVEARAQPPRVRRLGALLSGRRVAFGVAAIFAYVGAEVTIGTLAVEYLTAPDRLGLSAAAAGRAVGLYWTGAMIGRFAGAWTLARVRAPILLTGAGLLAMALVAIAILPTGAAGAGALLGVGLANSVMFPTIFALAMPTDRRDVPAVSMLLCMAVMGGAIVPMVTGLVADAATLSIALVVPMACYAVILAFAGACARADAIPA